MANLHKKHLANFHISHYPDSIPRGSDVSTMEERRCDVAAICEHRLNVGGARLTPTDSRATLLRHIEGVFLGPYT